MVRVVAEPLQIVWPVVAMIGEAGVAFTVPVTLVLPPALIQSPVPTASTKKVASADKTFVVKLLPELKIVPPVSVLYQLYVTPVSALLILKVVADPLQTV